MSGDAAPPDLTEVEGNLAVSLKRSASSPTDDLALSSVIRRAANAISFDRYMDFMDWIFCGDRKIDNDPELSTFASSAVRTLRYIDRRRFLPFTDTDAYRNIKAATEAFLMANCCIYNPETDEPSYIADHVAIDPALIDLQDLFNNYLGAGPDKILPYLAVIRAKLADERIRGLGSRRPEIRCGWQPEALAAWQEGLLAHQSSRQRSCHGLLRHPAREAHLPVPARADLVVLARGGHARPDA